MVHHGAIEPDDAVEIDGLRLTSTARTIIDIARTAPFEQSVVIGDAALHLRKTTHAELTDQLIRAAHRPGCQAARRVLAFLDGRSESVGESRSRVALNDPTLPPPELQPRILTPDGTFIARVDFLWPTLGVVGEFDGRIKYHKSIRGNRPLEAQILAEKTREDTLRAQGWSVTRWTWQHLTSPTHLRARIHTAATLSHHNPKGSWHPAL